MSEYIVKIGFWLRAHDGFTVEAESDADAIEQAKAAAKTVMESRAYPEHIDIEERREGVIAFIDHITPAGRQAVSRPSSSTTTASTTSLRPDRRITR